MLKPSSLKVASFFSQQKTKPNPFDGALTFEGLRSRTKQRAGNRPLEETLPGGA